MKTVSNKRKLQPQRWGLAQITISTSEFAPADDSVQARIASFCMNEQHHIAASSKIAIARIAAQLPDKLEGETKDAHETRCAPLARAIWEEVAKEAFDFTSDEYFAAMEKRTAPSVKGEEKATIAKLLAEIAALKAAK